MSLLALMVPDKSVFKKLNVINAREDIAQRQHRLLSWTAACEPDKNQGFVCAATSV